MKNMMTVDQLAKVTELIESVKLDMTAPLGRLSMEVVDPETDKPDQGGVRGRLGPLSPEGQELLQALVGKTGRIAQEEEGEETLPQRLEPRLHLEGDQAHGIRTVAHQQLSQVLGIHGSYYRKCLDADPALLAYNVNRWLHSDRLASREHLVRTLAGDVRAILSPSYRRLDNFDLQRTAIQALGDAGAEVESCGVTEDRLYIKAFSAKIEGEVRAGDVIRFGVVVSGSEVGHGAISVTPMALRLACLNGMVVGETIANAILRRIHLGKRIEVSGRVQEFVTPETQRMEDDAFFAQVGDHIRGVLNPAAFGPILDRWRASVGREIPAGTPLPGLMEVTRRSFGLRLTESDLVLRHLAEGAELTQWGMANAITRTAHDVPSYDRAGELEGIGGQIAELPARQWESLMSQAKEVKA